MMTRFKFWLVGLLGGIKTVRTPVPQYRPVSEPMTIADWENISKLFEREPVLIKYLHVLADKCENDLVELSPTKENAQKIDMIRARLGVFLDFIKLPGEATFQLNKLNTKKQEIDPSLSNFNLERRKDK